MTDDDDLRARLRCADPAASLEPASPAQVTHLVEEAMSRSTRRWAMPVAAALVLLAGGTAWAVTRSGTPAPAPAIAIATSPAPAPAKTVALTAAAEGPAKCAAPQPARLAERAGFAFEGTVTKIEDDRVTLAVSKVYRGEAATTVQVTQPGAEIAKAILTAHFETGKDYLVAAAADGQVLNCGYSGETEGLRGLYEAAF